MISEYIQAAMEKARYEIIDDPQPYYGSISNLKGVWATGRTLEQCRENLKDVLEGWIVLRLQRGLAIPRVGINL
jgi:predicted RNase H-like HicB family nuclease